MLEILSEDKFSCIPENFAALGLTVVLNFFLLCVSLLGNSKESHKKQYLLTVGIAFLSEKRPIKLSHNLRAPLSPKESVTLLAGPIKKLKLSWLLCRFMALYYPLFTALYYPLSVKHKCLHNEKSNITTDNAYSFG